MSKYLFILLFCISSSFGQNINQFKYVEVPQKFDFQKEANMFNLNVYTKMLLEKYGFVAYMNDETKPLEAANNNCDKVLHAKIDDQSSMFVRKLTVQLLDCQNKVVYSSKQGVSSTKDLKVAYVQALRMAFESFDPLNYKYNEESLEKATQIITAESTEVIAFEFVAKAIENGFILQSATLPEVRMQRSSIANYYIAQIGDLPGMIYKVGSIWKIDFYRNGVLETEQISIKF